ncbi:hypothetical protein EDC01DRAFT_780256 [Geopyxis carbonaria]|nr:hypothetical protein EDC01DRAFT_780256 [Geopyxis carbonaria]
MPNGVPIPPHVRAAILALHSTGMNFTDISLKLYVHPETARKIVKRVKERAGTEELRDLLKLEYLEDGPSGRDGGS